MIDNSRRALTVAGTLLAAAVVVGALVAVPSTRHDVQTVDDATRRFAVRIQNGPATDIAKALSLIAGTWVDWAIRAAVAVILAVRRKVEQLAAFALAVASSEVLIGTVKAAFHRLRPPGSLIGTSGASFPSGHAIAAAVTALGIVLAVVPPGPGRRRWTAFALGFALLVAISRVYLRAHWLSDAVAGSLVGVGLALGSTAVVQAAHDRRARPAVPAA